MKISADALGQNVLSWLYCPMERMGKVQTAIGLPIPSVPPLPNDTVRAYGKNADFGSGSGVVSCSIFVKPTSVVSIAKSAIMLLPAPGSTARSGIHCARRRDAKFFLDRRKHRFGHLVRRKDQGWNAHQHPIRNPERNVFSQLRPVRFREDIADQRHHVSTFI